MFDFGTASAKPQSAFVAVKSDSLVYDAHGKVIEIPGESDPDYPLLPQQAGSPVGSLKLCDTGLQAKASLLNRENLAVLGIAGTGKTTLVTSLLADIWRQWGCPTLWSKADSEYLDVGTPIEHPVLKRGSPGVVAVALGHNAVSRFRSSAPKCSAGFGRNVMTFHALLAYAPTESNDSGASMFAPRRTSTSKLPPELKVVIIEEAGLLTLDHLMLLDAALEPGYQLILLGDIGQIASIGGQSILLGALANGMKSFELTKVWRHGGDILSTCMAIRSGVCEPMEVGTTSVSPDKSVIRISYPAVIVSAEQANIFCANLLFRLFKLGKYIMGVDLALCPQHGVSVKVDGSDTFGIYPIWRALASKIDVYYGRLTYLVQTRSGPQVLAVGDVMFLNLGMGLHTYMLLHIAPNPRYGGGATYEPKAYATRDPELWKLTYLDQNPGASEGFNIDMDDMLSFGEPLTQEELDPMDTEKGQSRKSPFIIIPVSVTAIQQQLIEAGYAGKAYYRKLQEILAALTRLSLKLERSSVGSALLPPADIQRTVMELILGFDISLTMDDIPVLTSGKDIASLLPPILSTYKSQGIEGRNVVFLGHSSCIPLTREMMYTGLTRARDTVVSCSHAGMWGKGFNATSANLPKTASGARLPRIAGVDRVSIEGVTLAEKVASCVKMFNKAESNIIEDYQAISENPRGEAVIWAKKYFNSQQRSSC